MKNWLRAMLALFLLAAALPVAAHEFWLWAEPFALAAGGSSQLTLSQLTLNVGEYFTGETIPFSATQTAALRHYAAGTSADLRSRIPADALLPELRMAFTQAGTQLVAYDSQPTGITLPAEKFHAYLHDEGLDGIIRRREATGKAQVPGRERYRRHVKALLNAGGRSDQTYAASTGQRLEIVPLADPYARKAGDVLGFRLLFDGKPLAGALAKAWHKRGEQTLIIRARTGFDGKVEFDLPYAGPWMVSVVHMIPAVGTTEADWDSFWGNLTFELPGK
jgi:hypothetical protein